MATKTIAIMDDVYEILKSLKHEDESFSEELRRLVSKKRDIMEFAGAWSEEDASAIEKAIEKQRKARASGKWKR